MSNERTIGWGWGGFMLFLLLIQVSSIGWTLGSIASSLERIADASDRDAAPRKAAGFEAVGQQPGPRETAASFTPSRPPDPHKGGVQK